MKRKSIATLLLILFSISGCEPWLPTEEPFEPALVTSAYFSTAADTQRVYVNATHAIDAPVKHRGKYRDLVMPGLANATVLIQYNDTLVQFREDTIFIGKPGYYSAYFTPEPGTTYHLFAYAEGYPPLQRTFVVPGDFEILSPTLNDTVQIGSTLKLRWTPSQSALCYFCDFIPVGLIGEVNMQTLEPGLTIENFGIEKGYYHPYLVNQKLRLRIRAWWKSNPEKELGEIQVEHVVETIFFTSTDSLKQQEEEPHQ